MEINVVNEINRLQKVVQQRRDERARAQANLETAEKQKAEVLQELHSLGVKPEELEAEIERVTKAISDNLKRAAELLGVG